MLFENSPGYTRQLVEVANVFLFTTNLVLRTDTDPYEQYYCSTNYVLCIRFHNSCTVSSQQSKRFNTAYNDFGF